eukprot:2658585-Pyramimonas_sp.AAC.1
MAVAFQLSVLGGAALFSLASGTCLVWVDCSRAAALRAAWLGGFRATMRSLTYGASARRPS